MPQEMEYSINEIPKVELVEPDLFSGSAGAETKSDTSSDQNNADDQTTVRPMLDLLQLGSFDSFVIDCQAGLTGKSVMAKFPCVNDGNKRFYVWLGQTEFALFGKSTFMNFANLAESKGAKELYLVLDKDNAEIK